MVVQIQSSTEVIGVLKRMNSTLSEDCDKYIGEVSKLSMEREKLNDKVTTYEEKIKVSCTTCKYIYIYIYIFICTPYICEAKQYKDLRTYFYHEPR